MQQEHEMYRKLKAGILDLTFPPGTLLQEGQLGETFGVSRTPAREALRDLLLEGLIIKMGRFYQVKQYTVEEIRLVYEVREGHECLAGRLTTERATDQELKQLRQGLEEHYKKITKDAYPSVGELSIHLQIAQLARNELLFQQLLSLHDKVLIIARLSDARNRDRFMDAIEDHFRIVDALQRRSTPIVEEETRLHIRKAIKVYKETF
jgi:DNA-binding GntR family transcriptional regulator